jgi:hypothetical protein
VLQNLWQIAHTLGYGKVVGVLHRHGLALEDGSMLSILLNYHDGLYLLTELGVLLVVLLACWLVPKVEHRGHEQS